MVKQEIYKKNDFSTPAGQKMLFIRTRLRPETRGNTKWKNIDLPYIYIYV